MNLIIIKKIKMFLITIKKEYEIERHIYGVTKIGFTCDQTQLISNLTEKKEVIEWLTKKYQKIIDEDCEDEDKYYFAEIVLKSLENIGEWVNLESRWDTISMENNVLIEIKKIKFEDEIQHNTINYNWNSDAH